MISIDDVCVSTGLNLDEVRMILSDTRGDWDTCKEISKSEFNLIQQSVQTVNAALPEGGSAITPVNPEEMSLPLQQKLVDNASQILEFPLAMQISQEIQMVQVLQDAKNKVILAITEQKRQELNNALHLQSESDQKAFVGAMHQLLGLCPKQKNDDTVQKMLASSEKTNQTIAELFDLMGK